MESNYSFQQEDAFFKIVHAEKRCFTIEIKTHRCVQYKVALKRGNELLTKKIALLAAQLSRLQSKDGEADPSLLSRVTNELESAKIKASIEEWSPVRNNDRSFQIVTQYPTTVKPYETCMVPGPNLSFMAMDALPCIRNLVHMVLNENHFKTFPRDVHFRIVSNKEGFYLLCKDRDGSTATHKRKQADDDIPTFDGSVYAFDTRAAKVLVDSQQSVTYSGAICDMGISVEGYTTLLYQKKPALVDAARTFLFGKHAFRCCACGPDASRFIYKCRHPNAAYKPNPDRREVCIWAKEKNEVVYLSEEEDGANVVVFCVAKEPTKEEEEQIRDHIQGIKGTTAEKIILNTSTDDNLPFVQKIDTLLVGDEKHPVAQMRCDLNDRAPQGVRIRNIVQRIVQVCKTRKDEYQERFSPFKTGVENRGPLSDDVLYPGDKHWVVYEEEHTVMKRIERLFPSMYETYHKKTRTYGVGGGTRLRDLLSAQEHQQVVRHLLPVCPGEKHTARLKWLGECTVRRLRTMKQRYVGPAFPPKTKSKRLETLMYKPLGDLSVRFQLYEYKPGDGECMRDKYGMVDGSFECPTSWWYRAYGRCRIVPKDGMDQGVLRLARKVVNSRYWKRLVKAQLQLKNC